MTMTDADDGEVRTEVRDHVLVMTVDRQAKRNAFTPHMLRQLTEAYTRLDGDDSLWVGVLSFAGDHSTGGLDLPRFFGADAEGFRRGDDDQVDPLGLGRRCTKPIVTAVQGITFTIGIELLLAGDLAVAASDCRFSQLEPRRGLVALGGATFRFVERGGWGNGMYHLLVAGDFDAAEAHRIGIVQEVVAPGQQVERAIQLAQLIAANAPLAVQATKANAQTWRLEGEAAAIAELPGISARMQRTEDVQEGMASFIERRAATFHGR